MRLSVHATVSRSRSRSRTSALGVAAFGGAGAHDDSALFGSAGALAGRKGDRTFREMVSCQNDVKKGPEIATKSKNAVKNERRNRCENLLLFKRCRKSNKLAQGAI